MPQHTSEPRFDPATVEFPTDRITFLQLRRADAAMFRHDSLASLTAANIDVVGTYALELELAENALARVLDKPEPHTLTSRSDTVASLNEAYKRYEISSGIQQTRQLVRQFETAAAKQAVTSKRPGR